MTIKLDISKVTASSYLSQQPEPIRKLAEECAKAFIRGRSSDPELHAPPAPIPQKDDSHG